VSRTKALFGKMYLLHFRKRYIFFKTLEPGTLTSDEPGFLHERRGAKGGIAVLSFRQQPRGVLAFAREEGDPSGEDQASQGDLNSQLRRP